MDIPNAETRKRIVYRIDNSKSVVQASAITNIEELAYAIGFLAHHRPYKLSKGGVGVTLENAEDVAMSLAIAAEEFTCDVLDKLDETEDAEPPAQISELAEGEVVNPFKYV